MKKILMALAVIAATFSSTAMAQGLSTQGLMFGGMVGFVKPHGSDNEAGGTIGVRVGQPIQGAVSWEADANLGLIDGRYASDRSYNINSIAAYGVYRTQGDVHLKAKLGVAYWNDDFDHDTSLSAGIGLGLRMGRGIVDVEYTQINSYVDYITVSYTMPF